MRSNRSAWQDREATYSGPMHPHATRTDEYGAEDRLLEDQVAAELAQARAEWSEARRACRRLAGGDAQEELGEATGRRALALQRFRQALDRFARVVIYRDRV